MDRIPPVTLIFFGAKSCPTVSYISEKQKREVNTHMYGQRSGIKNNLLAFQEVYHHIRQFDHFNLSMNVCILEKINHNSNNPNLSTLHRRHKSIRAMAPSYFKDKYVPIITYSSTALTAHKVCNYTKSLKIYKG